jgi:hypothetical protein
MFSGENSSCFLKANLNQMTPPTQLHPSRPGLRQLHQRQGMEKKRPAARRHPQKTF